MGAGPHELLLDELAELGALIQDGMNSPQVRAYRAAMTASATPDAAAGE